MNLIKHSKRNILVLLRIIIITSTCLSPSLSWATPDYSEKTEQGCKICHLDEEGGKLSIEGLEFAASGYVWPPKGGYRVLGPIRKPVRLILGIFHILAAFMWFGTILYVHIILRPGYAARGLPKVEVALGMVSMAVVGITGILLTVSKIKSIEVLYMSPWGITLSIKIILYIIMVSSALFVVFFVGPKLKKGLKKTATLKTKVFDSETLLTFDGKDGMPVYIAYKGKVYDVTALKRWKNGTHMKHPSGRDLTDSLARAPHGEEKLDSLKVVGSYDASLSPPKTFAQMAFYFIAYMNLIIVFCVLFVIAYWRWGL
jgi:predicted heme/steroid binding protein